MISIPVKLVIFITGMLICITVAAQEENNTAEQPQDIQHIQVSGLLGPKVVLLINSKQYVLKAGDTTPEAIKVISVESEGAVLEIGGVKEFYSLGSDRVATAFTQVKTLEERVYKDVAGMYRTVGTINGLPVNFLVDTGATTVAINRNEAKRLGINFLLDGESGFASTASGVIKSYRVKLNSISVGQIKMTNVDAMVIDGDSPLEVLLGMSFLGKLNVQHKNETMVLEKKY